MKLKKEWIAQGFIDEPVDESLDLKKEIRKLCEEKNAVILAHYYTQGEIQDIADFIGDSLALAQQAAKTNADIIMMCGVHFMAETDKILCPDKKVLVPDVKALTDIVVTSGNAKKIVDTFPKDAKLIFGPDYNLGSYINSITGRNMLLWNGGCHVHERFSVDGILALKKEHPEAVILAHPECKGPVLAVADVVGSTAVILKYAIESDKKEFIVATEAGILHEMERKCVGKTFYPVPPEVSEGGVGCSCNECDYMKMNSLLKIYNALKYEWPEVDVDAEIAKEAVKPINRMLELS